MQQVLESDRKIRGASLLKFSKVTLSDIHDAVHVNINHQRRQHIMVLE